MSSASPILLRGCLSFEAFFFSSDENPAWIAEVHSEAFRDPNILALYYIYTQAGVQASKGECEACQ